MSHAGSPHNAASICLVVIYQSLCVVCICVVCACVCVYVVRTYMCGQSNLLTVKFIS